MSKFCGNCGTMMEDEATVCGMCGTPFADSAENSNSEEADKKFCGNCGATMNSDAVVCGVCGTPFGGGTLASENDTDNRTNDIAPPLTPQQEKIKKGIMFGAIGVGGLIVLIIVINILSAIFTGGYKKAVKYAVDGFNDRNFDKYLSGISKIAVQSTLDDNDEEDLADKWKDTVDDVVDSWEDSYEEKIGKNPELTYEIKDVEDLSNYKKNALIKYIEKQYKDYDEDNITDIKVVSVKLRIEGSKDDRILSAGKLYVIKADGEWGIYTGGFPTEVYASDRISIPGTYNMFGYR